MPIDWIAITVLHAALFPVLGHQRHRDHPWLLRYLGGIWLADLVGLLVATPRGLDLLAPLRSTFPGDAFLVILQLVTWLTFWILPALAAVHLARGRVHPSLLWGVVGVTVILSALYYLRLAGRLPTAATWYALHGVVEPAALLLIVLSLAVYARNCFRAGHPMDLLALSLMLLSVNLFMKLIFALKPGFQFDQAFSIIYHVISLTAFFSCYAVVKLRERSRNALPKRA